MLYLIRRQSDGLWLMSHVILFDSPPVCLWGEHLRDACVFDDEQRARALKRAIPDKTSLYIAHEESGVPLREVDS